MKPESIEVYKETSDSWCPSYVMTDKYTVVGTMLVKVSLLELVPVDGDYRVCVWGQDDMGMEKDFDNREDAMTCFLQVIEQDIVTMDYLESLGMYSA